MEQESITRYIADTFSGVDVVVASAETGAPEVAWDDTFFIYDPDRNLEPKQQMPFATIVTKDYGEYDCLSNLNRPGIYRLNIGISKESFLSLFGTPPAGTGNASAEYDFAAVDRLLPHPVYGAMHWVCILNPSDSTFQSLKPLLSEAHELAASRVRRQTARQHSPGR